MRITPQRLPEVLLVEPRVFNDSRGYFLETYAAARYESSGLPGIFVQDNVSFSRRGVVRGLHYQYPTGQGKLVMALAGEIFDVAVDIRRGSPTFGQWVAATLSGATHNQLYIPPGFAHGFCVTSETALVSYKCTAPYDPSAEGSVLYSDPDVGIPWPTGDALLSEKDMAAPPLRAISEQRLPP